MKALSRSLIYIFLLAFIFAGTSSGTAQVIFGKKLSQVKIIPEVPIPGKAIYHFKAGSQKATLTLTKKGNAVNVRIKNEKCVLGQASISARNGKVTVNSSNLHKGTLGIWAYALGKIGVREGKIVLTPRKGLEGCDRGCVAKLRPIDSWFWPINKIPGFPGGEEPPVCYPVKDEVHKRFNAVYGGALTCAARCK